MYQSYMHDSRRHFQHATKLYKLLKIFMCFKSFCIPSSCENKINQTAQTLGSHIYSTNVHVDIPRLWHDISRFLMHVFDKNILPMKHWKCKVCLHFWLLLCETGRHSNCFSYSTTGWASDRLVGVYTPRHKCWGYNKTNVYTCVRRWLDWLIRARLLLLTESDRLSLRGLIWQCCLFE